MKNVSVLILAGGRSERMGSPKPFLLKDGMTFIENIVNGYFHFEVKQAVLVLNNNFIRFLPSLIQNVKIVPNNHPEMGRLYSLKKGLKQLSDSDFIFIQNVDNPFVERNVLNKMWACRSSHSFVMPVFSGKGGHPILLPKKIVRSILSENNAFCTLKEILQKFDRIEVETGSDKIFTNINTWNDYEKHVLKAIPEYCYD